MQSSWACRKLRLRQHQPTRQCFHEQPLYSLPPSFLCEVPYRKYPFFSRILDYSLPSAVRMICCCYVAVGFAADGRKTYSNIAETNKKWASRRRRRGVLK